MVVLEKLTVTELTRNVLVSWNSRNSILGAQKPFDQHRPQRKISKINIIARNGITTFDVYLFLQNQELLINLM